MATSHQPIQISAIISAETKARLEAYVREHGIKQSFLVERALQHHLAAMDAIPSDVLIPPVVIINKTSAARLAERLINPPPPTEEMKALFNG